MSGFTSLRRGAVASACLPLLWASASASRCALFIRVPATIHPPIHAPGPQGAAQDPQAGTQARPMGRAFLFRIDAQEGRRRGWAPAEATDSEIYEHVLGSMRNRIRSSGRFVEAQAALEPEGLLSVTFVGRMAQSIESMLSSGLGGIGRLEWALPLPSTQGIDLDLERARLARWLAARRDAGETPDPIAFAALSPADGGPDPVLRWAPELGGEEQRRWSADAWRPLATESLRLVRRDALASLRMRSEGRDWSMFVAPLEEVRELFAQACSQSPDRALDARGSTPTAALLFDGCVAPPLTRTVTPDGTELFGVPFGRGLGIAREFLLSFAGEPLQAPLSFAGFDKRPLANVVTHIPGDDD